MVNERNRDRTHAAHHEAALERAEDHSRTGLQPRGLSVALGEAVCSP